jgi:hypothetical protein
VRHSAYRRGVAAPDGWATGWSGQLRGGSGDDGVDVVLGELRVGGAGVLLADSTDASSAGVGTAPWDHAGVGVRTSVSLSPAPLAVIAAKIAFDLIG